MRKPREGIEELILDYITKSINEGLPPTVREICKELNIKSTSTAHKYLKVLEEKGHISTKSNLNRSIQLCRTATVKYVPLVGQVTAGEPILAMENITDYVPFDVKSLEDNELFALKVRGESMINAAILDGDLIVCKKTAYAQNGEIVVAMIDDEATVKRFFKEDGHYRLQPENDTMEPILADEVSILGKVVSVMRRYS